MTEQIVDESSNNFMGPDGNNSYNILFFRL